MPLYRFAGYTPTVGSGSYVSPLAAVIGDVHIGENCYIGHGVIIRGDYGKIIIGSGSAVEEGVIVHAPPQGVSQIGKGVIIGHGAIIHSENIADNAVIGMGAILSTHSTVSEWAIVAEGCVVRNRQCIPEKVVAAGNPASVVRTVQQRDIDFWTWGKQLYVNLAGQYLKDDLELISLPISPPQ